MRFSVLAGFADVVQGYVRFVGNPEVARREP